MCGQFLVAGKNLKVMFSIKGNLKVMFSINGNLKVMKKNDRRFPQHFIPLARFHNKI